MRFEIFQNQRYHDTLKQLREGLIEAGLWDGLVSEAIEKLPKGKEAHSLEVTFTSMQRWISQLESEAEALNFTPQDSVRGIKAHLDIAVKITEDKLERQNKPQGYDR
jgi:hypothetical protein